MVTMASNRVELARRLAALRAAIDDRKNAGGAVAAVTPVCPSLDAALPGGGLRRGAVHEILGPEPAGERQSDDWRNTDRRGDAAAMGFAAVLLGRILHADPAARPAVWCLNRHRQHQGGPLPGQPYPPGLSRFGIAVERLLFLHCQGDGDAVWATEEAVRSTAAAAVVAELDRLKPFAARRLQLAAEAAGTTVMILRPGDEPGTASFADTCWRLQAMPALTVGQNQWHATLLRCRGGNGGRAWLLRWQNARLQADPADAAAIAAGRPAASVAMNR